MSPPPVARFVNYYAVEELVPNSTDYNLVVKVVEVHEDATVLKRTRNGKAVPVPCSAATVGDETGVIRLVTTRHRAAFAAAVSADAVVVLLHVHVRRVSNQVYIEADHLVSKLLPIADHKPPFGIPVPALPNTLLDFSDATAVLDKEEVARGRKHRGKLQGKQLFKQLERFVAPLGNVPMPKEDTAEFKAGLAIFLQRPFVDRSFLLHAMNSERLRKYLQSIDMLEGGSDDEDEEEESEDDDDTESKDSQGRPLRRDPSDAFCRDPSGTGMSTLMSKDWKRDERSKGRQIRGSRTSRRGVPNKEKRHKGNSTRHVQSPTGIVRRLKKGEVESECTNPADFALA